MGEQVFAVVDCDNFFASCEKVFRPDLSDKPLVVLSNNDGCVVARSQEAKDLGIPMGAPAFKWEEFFQKNSVHRFSGNFSLYGDLSERIVKIISQSTPDIEVYSIDESFLRLDKTTDNPDKFARDLRSKILKWTGISVSIGAAPSKTLAKAAVEYAKKHPETNRVLTVLPDSDLKLHKEVLDWLPVKDIWGIGRRLTPKLHSFGIHTASDYCELPEGWVKSELGIQGLRIYRELKGESYYRLEPDRFEWRKNIAATRSFGKDVTQLHELEEAVASHVVRAARKLRGQKGVTQCITVFADTGRKRSGKFYRDTQDIKLPVATDFTPKLLKSTLKSVPEIFKEGKRFYRSGVIFRDITPSTQLSLLEEVDTKEKSKEKRLINTIDNLNHKWGEGMISFGSEGLDKSWIAKKEHKSQPYTRSWKYLPKVAAN